MAKLELGLIAKLDKGPEAALMEVQKLGFPTCQIDTWNAEFYTRENARAVSDAAAKTGVRISALWSGYPGPHVWDFIQGPVSIGFPPAEWRAVRVKAMKQAGKFAQWLNLPAVVTHAGFIPENPNNPDYKATVRACRQIATAYKKLGIEFWLETGQETPVTLLRLIEDIGLDNVGVNLDPANLIMYGKANPVDALDVFGKHVKGCHAKDGCYPTTGRNLGPETPLGKGKVDFPALLQKLYKLGYRGPLTIEREISGAKQVRDIKQGKKFLEDIIRKIR